LNIIETLSKNYDGIILDLEGTMQKPGYFASARPAFVDGLAVGLKILKDAYPLFIVSNCDNKMLSNFLDTDDMRSYFKDWECLGNTGLSKSENIKDIINRNSIKLALYVGDSFPDIQAAKMAGIDYIHAAYGLDGWADSEKNFESFEDIVKYLT